MNKLELHQSLNSKVVRDLLKYPTYPLSEVVEAAYNDDHNLPKDVVLNPQLPPEFTFSIDSAMIIVDHLIKVGHVVHIQASIDGYSVFTNMIWLRTCRLPLAIVLAALYSEGIIKRADLDFCAQTLDITISYSC